MAPKKDSNHKQGASTKRTTIKDEDLKFFIGDQQAEKYDRLIKYMMAEAQKEFGYPIAYVVEYRKEYSFEIPKKEISVNKDSKAPAEKNIAFEAIFQQEIKSYSQQKKEYEKQKQQLCGIIVKKMLAGLEESMKKESEYPMKKGTDPIWLLDKIDYYCKMYRGNKYLPAVYMNAVRDIVEITQGPLEPISAYAERLKSRMNLMWKTMEPEGNVIYCELVDTLVSESESGKVTNKEAAAKARERILAFHLINRANNKRFGDLKEEIKKLESRDIEKYPETFVKSNRDSTVPQAATEERI